MAKRKPQPQLQTGAEPASTAEPSAVGSLVRDFGVWALVLFAVLAFLCTWGQFDFRDAMGYYGMFADALQKGHLYLDYTPDQVNLTDMIPYNGRYYFQWGPFPVLFHLALRMVGVRLTDRVFCLVVGWLTALCFLGVIRTLGKRYFPEIPKSVYVWFLFCFALGTPAALVTVRGVIYNESIGFASLCTLGAFWVFLGYQRKAEGVGAFGMGCLIAAAGLTRVSMILYAVPFFLALAIWERIEGRSNGTMLARLALFSLPVLASGGVHMVNNQERFGSPFDFGREYKPESIENPDVKPFDMACAPENFAHYFLALPRLSADFPYVAHEGWPGATCAQRAEASSSLILAGPFLLLGLFAWPLFRPGDAHPFELRFAAWFAAAAGGMMLLIMMAFVAASRRYAQDFLPLLMALVFLGFALLWQRGLDWKRWRIAAWAVFAWSALFNINVPFYQSFYTPTPDLNVIRVFVKMKPTLDGIAPGPQLDEHAAIAANDLGSALLNERRLPEALEAFEKAAAWWPQNDKIRQNVELVRRMMGR
ncbi:MAG: hypothetical protein R2748_02370 [Bryobacterales bacterium]